MQEGNGRPVDTSRLDNLMNQTPKGPLQDVSRGSLIPEIPTPSKNMHQPLNPGERNSESLSFSDTHMITNNSMTHPY